jgi:hypothetical protein
VATSPSNHAENIRKSESQEQIVKNNTISKEKDYVIQHIQDVSSPNANSQLVYSKMEEIDADAAFKKRKS